MLPCAAAASLRRLQCMDRSDECSRGGRVAALLHRLLGRRPAGSVITPKGLPPENYVLAWHLLECDTCISCTQLLVPG